MSATSSSRFRPLMTYPGVLREIERLELLSDGVEAPHGAAVVVLVVALHEGQGQAAQRPGTAVDLFQVVTHGIPPSKG